MGVTRKELEKIYQIEKKKYRRVKGRDKDILNGIDILYTAILNYIDGEYNDRN